MRVGEIRRLVLAPLKGELSPKVTEGVSPKAGSYINIHKNTPVRLCKNYKHEFTECS